VTIGAISGRSALRRRRCFARRGLRREELDQLLPGIDCGSGAELVEVDDSDLHVVQVVAVFDGMRAHDKTQLISRLMTRASFLPRAGSRTSLVAYRSPLLGIAVPLREMRASTTTLLNCDSLREAIIAMESSR